MRDLRLCEGNAGLRPEMLDWECWVTRIGSLGWWANPLWIQVPSRNWND